MKKRLIKHDKFLVWIFTMNKGDVKYFDPKEVTRGLTDYGPFTANAISVYTKGKFAVHRDGREPWIAVPGTQPARFVDADSLRDFRIEALEDGSEYHCIIPREDTPRFWNRSTLGVVRPVYYESYNTLVPGFKHITDTYYLYMTESTVTSLWI